MPPMNIYRWHPWRWLDNQNRVQYAKSKGIHDSLLKLYNGNEDELNRRLDLLCDISRTVDKTPGKTRSDVLLFRDIESGKQPTEHYTQRERDNREIVLWRFENIHALQQVALQVAKERNIDYQLSTVYETDGQHQNRTTYMAARQAQAKVKGYKRAVYADKKLQKCGHINDRIFAKLKFEKLSKDDFKEIIETLSEVNFCDKAIKYIANRNLQFRQVVKIIVKSEQLAQTNKLREITEEIIKGVIDEE